MASTLQRAWGTYSSAVFGVLHMMYIMYDTRSSSMQRARRAHCVVAGYLARPAEWTTSESRLLHDIAH